MSVQLTAVVGVWEPTEAVVMIIWAAALCRVISCHGREDVGTVVVADNDGETVGIGGVGGAVEGNCGKGKLDREETFMSRFVTTTLSINSSTWQRERKCKGWGQPPILHTVLLDSHELTLKNYTAKC